MEILIGVLNTLSVIIKFIVKCCIVATQAIACYIVNSAVLKEGFLFIAVNVFVVLVLIYNVYAYFGKEYKVSDKNIH